MQNGWLHNTFYKNQFEITFVVVLFSYRFILFAFYAHSLIWLFAMPKISLI